MLSQTHILQYLKDIKSELYNDGIEKIGLFGSYAKEDYDLLSDVDIVIKTSERFLKKHPSIQAFIYFDLLREKLQQKLHKEVDICDESGLKDKSILKDAIYV